MIILLVFVFLFFIFYKRKARVILLLLSINLLSLLGAQLIERDIGLDGFSVVFFDLITMFFLLIVIIPWYSFSGVVRVLPFSNGKVKSLSYLFVALSVPPFLIFSYMSVQLYSQGFDINSFKYAPDVGRDFRHSLSINRYAFGLALLLVNISYFLVPLHMFLLSKGRWFLAVLLFVLSLNPVVFGLTYFSRSAIIHYALVYLFFLFFLYDIFDKKKKKIIRNAAFFVLTLGGLYFLSVTFDRFDDHYFYEGKIPETSIFYGNASLYSLVDYLSQWYYNNLELLDSYQFRTFEGGVSLHLFYTILSEVKVISYDYNEVFAFRRQLWPNHSVSFNGLVAYSIYDYGYFLTVVFSGLYFIFVRNARPKRSNGVKSIKLEKLFTLSILIQIPLFSIFYSSVSSLIMPILFLGLFKIYIKVGFYMNGRKGG